jgi:hypothetical protein
MARRAKKLKAAEQKAALKASKHGNGKANGKSNGKATPEAAAATDPFDTSSLCLPQDFEAAAGGVKKVLNTLPVRKPGRQEFVRVHPEIRGIVALIEDRADRVEYFLSGKDFIRAVNEALPGEVISKCLFLAVTRQGTAFLWPVRLPPSDGKAESDWTRSLREAAHMAVDTWLRVASNRSLGAYETFTAPKITTEPTWPDLSEWKELLRVAFRSRLITDFAHPLIRNLTGE